MSKTLYMTAAAPTSHRGNNDVNVVGTAAWWAAKALSETRGTDTTGTVQNGIATVAGPTNGLEYLSGGTAPMDWVSEPLSADFGISGSITFNLWAVESSMTANVAVNAVVEKVSGADASITQLCKTANATELGTVSSANNFTASPISNVAESSRSGGTPTVSNPIGTSAATQRFAQSFIATDSGPLLILSIYMARVGTPTDNLNFSLQTDNAGVPSGTVLGTGSGAAGSFSTTAIDSSGIGIAPVNTLLTVGTKYWMVFERSGSFDAVNYYNILTFSTDVYASGEVKQYVSGAWTSAQNDCRFQLTHMSYVRRGDRIRVHTFADDGGGNMASGFTSNFQYDRSTAAQGESYITFTENLTFEPAGDVPTSLSQPTNASSNSVGAAAASAVLGQPFTALTNKLDSLTLALSRGNSPPDNLIIEIQSDSAGAPSGTVVGTVANIVGSSLTTSNIDYTWSNLGIVLVSGATYWIVLRRTGSVGGGTNYAVGTANSVVTGWGQFKYYDSGTTIWGSGQFNVLRSAFTFLLSTYYLTDTAETINPGSATEKKALTTRGSGSVNTVTNTATGPTAGIQLTASAGGTAVEWYTPPLNAFTLGGKAKFNIRGLESSGAADASLKAEIAVCNNDGTSPVVWGVTDLDVSIGGEVFTVDGSYVAWPSGDDVAVTAGQRLRFRIYVDDDPGAPLATGFTVTISYNGTSAAAAGDSYVILPMAVTEQVTTVTLPSIRFNNYMFVDAKTANAGILSVGEKIR